MSVSSKTYGARKTMADEEVKIKTDLTTERSIVHKSILTSLLP